MRLSVAINLFVAMSLCACQPSTTTTGSSLDSVSLEGLRLAQAVVTSCARNAPNTSVVVNELKKAGLVDRTAPEVLVVKASLPPHQTYSALENAALGVKVIVTSSTGEGKSMKCLLGVKEMTVAQGTNVAQPWVQKFKANTDQKNGHFAIQGGVAIEWRSVADRNYTRVAVTPKLKSLKARGAGVWMDFSTKKSGSKPYPTLTYTLR